MVSAKRRENSTGSQSNVKGEGGFFMHAHSNLTAFPLQAPSSQVGVGRAAFVRQGHGLSAMEEKCPVVGLSVLSLSGRV